MLILLPFSQSGVRFHDLLGVAINKINKLTQPHSEVFKVTLICADHADAKLS